MTKILLLTLLSAILCVSCAPPQSSSSQTASVSPTAVPQEMQATGAFDYYLLTLSWAPEFCYSKPNNPECSGHFGFIVHGLWPQYNRGGYPENCGQQPGPTNPSAMLDLMPDSHLIQHEWTTHGTCTGLAADNYFALIRRLRNSVKIPQAFVAPAQQFSMSPQELKQDFEQANPGLTDADLAVSCGSGPYLVAVEICFSKDGRLTQCGGDIRDCNRPQLRVPKVQ
jgi:ribonuclease T2